MDQSRIALSLYKNIPHFAQDESKNKKITKIKGEKGAEWEWKFLWAQKKRNIFKKNKKVLAFLKLLVYNKIRVKELMQLKNT